MDFVRSRQRVMDHGEVFTPPDLVDAMLRPVETEAARIDSRFLEPACGSGNFLAPVLTRKLATVQARYGKSSFEREHHALLALMCVYGIDLLPDNVTECRERLLLLFTDFVGAPASGDLHRAARNVLAVNVIHGDALSMTEGDTRSDPIAFAEWAYLGKGKFQRRDFRLDVLTQLSSFRADTLFGTVGKHDVFVPVREYPSLSIKALANE